MNGGIFCAVSGHGYGHLSQVAPILNHLGTLDPGLRIMVAGKLDRAVLEKFVRVPFSSDPGVRDIGLVQNDPLVVDLEATRLSYIAMQHRWEELVTAEMARLRAFNTNLVLVDIPCVTIAAAHRLNIPSVAIASLSWDHIIKAYFSLDDPINRGWWLRMRENYAKTTLALLPQPAIMGDTFPHYEVIPPLASPGRTRKGELRQALGIATEDERPLIMVNLGGMPSHTLPLEKIFQEIRYHWLFKETQLPSMDHVHAIHAIEPWPFEDILGSVNAVVSKPGYGTAVHSAVLGIPMLYVRRRVFPDEDPICTWLSEYGCALEIDAETFASGQWHIPLQTLFRQVPPPRPRCNGAEVAAKRIMELLGRVDIR
ncbi:MAG: hypothetical protein HQL07_05600 [Nitrospirae bacterium]|nr:hypothetical protein [Magnetococcales bacterium]